MKETQKSVYRNKSDKISHHDDIEALKHEMLYRLHEYKEEQKESILNMKPMKDENFKKNFYKSLENLLNQILNLKNESLKSQQITTLHKWFKSKLNFFNNITYIDKRTDKYYYEIYEDIDTNMKSEYYIAKNYPTYFERDHRTEEEGLLPPKDKIKEYRTKKITKELIKTNKDDYEDNKDKMRVASALSLAMRNTNYTDNNTMTKFFTPPEDNIDPRDMLYMNIAEKNILVAKQKEAAEKRHQEEMKEYLNEWGLAKSSYKEDIERRIDYKFIIKKIEEEDKIIDEELGEEAKGVVEDGVVDMVSPSISLIIQDNPVPVSAPSIKKVNIDKIINLNQHNKIIKNPDEIIVTIVTKQNETYNKDKIKSEMRHRSKVPSEYVSNMIMTDKIFQNRKIYSNICDLKEVDNPKESDNAYLPLSAYDNYNLYKKAKNNIDSRPMTGYDYVKKNINDSDYLHLRQTFSALEKKSVQKKYVDHALDFIPFKPDCKTGRREVFEEKKHAVDVDKSLYDDKNTKKGWVIFSGNDPKTDKLDADKIKDQDLYKNNTKRKNYMTLFEKDSEFKQNNANVEFIVPEYIVKSFFLANSGASESQDGSLDYWLNAYHNFMSKNKSPKAPKFPKVKGQPFPGIPIFIGHDYEAKNGIYPANDPIRRNDHLINKVLPNLENVKDNSFYLSLSRAVKIPYRYSVGDLLEKSGHKPAKTKDDFDFAERLFGRIIEREDKEIEMVQTDTLKGRVFFGDAVHAKSIGYLDKRHSHAGASSPKASFFPYYLAPEKESDTDHPYDYSKKESRIAGWKRYIVQKGQTKFPPHTKGNDTELYFLEASEEEPLVFTGKIKFHNISPEELNVLRWALTWGFENDCYHLIGRGKAQGYGRCQATITVTGKTNLGGEIPAYAKPTLDDKAVETLTAMARFGDAEKRLSYPSYKDPSDAAAPPSEATVKGYSHMKISVKKNQAKYKGRILPIYINPKKSTS